jgi:type I restriction enzyme M protein
MDADGLSLDDKRQPVAENDIPDLLKRWKERNSEQDTDRTEKAFFVPKAEIVANGYDLSINRYKEAEYAEVTYEPPKVILQKLRDLEDEIRADLDELERLLG